jgi:hypothetical protein
MVAGLENFRKTRYTITPGAVQASKANSLPQTPSTRGGFKNALIEDVGNSISNSRVSSSISSIDVQTANRLADSIDRLTKWNPSIAIETYERKRRNYEKITTGGLK